MATGAGTKSSMVSFSFGDVEISRDFSRFLESSRSSEQGSGCESQCLGERQSDPRARSALPTGIYFLIRDAAGLGGRYKMSTYLYLLQRKLDAIFGLRCSTLGHVFLQRRRESGEIA